MLRIRLELPYLYLNLYINKIFIFFITLLSFSLNYIGKIFAALFIIYVFKFSKLKDILISTNTSNDISFPEFVVGLGLLVLTNFSLLMFFFIKSKHNTRFVKNVSMSSIDQLISKDKVELALKKLYTCVNKNDEKLRNEIVLLRNKLYSYNRDRLNGLIPDEDYMTNKSKIVSRILDISD